MSGPHCPYDAVAFKSSCWGARARSESVDQREPGGTMDLRYRLRRAGLLRGTRRSNRTTGRDAVVFSSYVPNEQALRIAKQFLEVFRAQFADCDFFVGINGGSLPEWETALRDSGLRTMRIGNVSPELVVDSDVSGFQKALELMRREGKEYRLVWLGHTKGVTADHPELHRHPYRALLLGSGLRSSDVRRSPRRLIRIQHDPLAGLG